MTKYLDVARERDVFTAPESHGELWSAIDRTHAGEIDSEVARVLGGAETSDMFVLLTMHEFKHTPEPTWREFTISYPTNSDDFWIDFHNAIREEFETDTDRALNVGVLTVAPLVERKAPPKPKKKRKTRKRKSRAKRVRVKGYVRKDGVYIAPHWRKR